MITAQFLLTALVVVLAPVLHASGQVVHVEKFAGLAGKLVFERA